MMEISPVTLEGTQVRLAPLQADHCAALSALLTENVFGDDSASIRAKSADSSVPICVNAATSSMRRAVRSGESGFGGPGSSSGRIE